ncbi:metal-dependent hydrolase [Candidatus Woesearchaeota archaeon]|nr:metal-dependent hydrolase [Candidatus Woesearchaeota archaeon]
MKGRTHLAFAFFLSMYLTWLYEWPLLSVLVVLLGSLLPDIDDHRSILGKKVFPLSFVLKLFGHRGFFHSLLFIALLWLGLAYVGYEFFGTLLALGYVSHLLLDGFTPMGVRPFFPFDWKVRGPFPTGSWVEPFLFFGFVLGGLLCFILAL